MRYILKLTSIGLIASIFINMLLATLLTVTYTTLSKETPIATLYFEKVQTSGKKTYIAYLRDASGDKIGTYLIDGDQWQIDAGFYKLEYWAYLFGMESKYTLNRFKGRYKNIDDENTMKPKSYQLESRIIVDTFSWFIDASYGSSTYTDIELETLYSVLKTPTGLMVREKYIEPVQKPDYFKEVKTLMGL